MRPSLGGPPYSAAPGIRLAATAARSAYHRAVTTTRSLARSSLLLVAAAAASAPGAVLADGDAERLPPPTRTDALRMVPSGARIRVELDAGRTVGTFAGATSTELWLNEGGPTPARIRLDALRGLDRSLGRRSHALSGLRWGLVAGAAVGVLTTLAIGRGGDEERFSPAYTLLPPAAVGALAGLVFGATRSSECWAKIARW
jgi:hypothetical protein